MKWDTPEQVQDCLNCPLAECVDCIGKGLTLQYYLNKSKDAPNFYQKGKGRLFMEAWRDTDSDAKLAMATGLTLGTVRRYRIDYGLPPSRILTREAREALVKKWTGQ